MMQNLLVLLSIERGWLAYESEVGWISPNFNIKYYYTSSYYQKELEVLDNLNVLAVPVLIYLMSKHGYRGINPLKMNAKI